MHGIRQKPSFTIFEFRYVHFLSIAKQHVNNIYRIHPFTEITHFTLPKLQQLKLNRRIMPLFAMATILNPCSFQIILCRSETNWSLSVGFYNTKLACIRNSNTKSASFSYWIVYHYFRWLWISLSQQSSYCHVIRIRNFHLNFKIILFSHFNVNCSKLTKLVSKSRKTLNSFYLSFSLQFYSVNSLTIKLSFNELHLKQVQPFRFRARQCTLY